MSPKFTRIIRSLESIAYAALISAALILIPSNANAESKDHRTRDFKVSSSRLTDVQPNTPQAVLISRLKQLAVLDVVQARMGSRFAQVEPALTPEFSERFVLEYRVNRAANDKNAIELQGQLDIAALRGWITLEEAKFGLGWKPAYLFTSSVPGMTFGPKESAKRSRETAIGQAILSSVSPALQRANIRFLLPSDWGSSLQSPPKGEDELRSLRSAVSSGGMNGAVWVSLSPCAGCGTRLDITVYELNHPRLVWARSDELKLEPKDFASPEKVKRVVKESLKDFSSEFEEVISDGLLTSHPITLVIKDINSPRAYRDIINSLSDLDFAGRCLLKKSSAKSAEFEILTKLSTEEFAKNLEKEQFSNFNLSPGGYDSDSVTVRFTKM